MAQAGARRRWERLAQESVCVARLERRMGCQSLDIGRYFAGKRGLWAHFVGGDTNELAHLRGEAHGVFRLAMSGQVASFPGFVVTEGAIVFNHEGGVRASIRDLT